VGRKEGGAKDMKRLLNKTLDGAGRIFKMLIPNEETAKLMVEKSIAKYYIKR